MVHASRFQHFGAFMVLVLWKLIYEGTGGKIQNNKNFSFRFLYLVGFYCTVVVLLLYGLLNATALGCCCILSYIFHMIIQKPNDNNDSTVIKIAYSPFFGLSANQCCIMLTISSNGMANAFRNIHCFIRLKLFYEMNATHFIIKFHPSFNFN